MERFNFSRRDNGDLFTDEQTKLRFGRHWEQVKGTLPRSIVNAAAADLVSAARALEFTSGKSFTACSKHLMLDNPWYRCWAAAIAEDDSRAERDLGIVVVESRAA